MMDNKDQNIVKAKKTTFAERVKQMNAKKAIKSSTLLIGLVLIIFMTITDIIFDPSKFDVIVWLSKTLILVGISIFGLLMGESIGKDKLIEAAGGLYQTSLRLYELARIAIMPFYNYFGQYYTKYLVKELREKKIQFLVSNGFYGDEAEIFADNITELDIANLIKGPIEKTDRHGKKIGICKIDKTQKIILTEMARIKLDVPNFAYFLSANSSTSQQGIAEKGKQIPKERKFSRHFNRILKLSFTMVITAAWSILTVQDFMQGDNTQAWMNLITRLTAFATSFTSGWGSAIIDSKLASEELDNKTILLTEYSDALKNKEFLPEDYEQRYEREQREAELRKKAEEEALKSTIASIVEPEVVNAPKMIGAEKNGIGE